MGKIILIRHGKAGFLETDYDQLSDLGEYQAQVTGNFFKQARIYPATIYSGSLIRQQRTAEIVKKNAGYNTETINDPTFNEFDYQGIIDCFLPELLTEKPSIAKDVDKALTDYSTFRRIFSELIECWIHKNDHTGNIESFESYTNRVIQGINAVTEKLNKDDIAIVFTSGGFIAVSMHLILGLSPISALTLAWNIYNCSITSFYHSNNKYCLETFNSVGHLEMDARDGIVTMI